MEDVEKTKISEIFTFSLNPLDRYELTLYIPLITKSENSRGGNPRLAAGEKLREEHNSRGDSLKIICLRIDKKFFSKYIGSPPSEKAGFLSDVCLSCITAGTE